jgi:hypothetical protein
MFMAIDVLLAPGVFIVFWETNSYLDSVRGKLRAYENMSIWFMGENGENGDIESCFIGVN